MNQAPYDIACTPAAAETFCDRFEVLAILSETPQAMLVRCLLSPMQFRAAKQMVARMPGCKLFSRGEVVAEGEPIEEPDFELNIAPW